MPITPQVQHADAGGVHTLLPNEFGQHDEPAGAHCAAKPGPADGQHTSPPAQHSVSPKGSDPQNCAVGLEQHQP